MRRRRVDFSEKGMADFQKNLYNSSTTIPQVYGAKYAYVYGVSPLGKHLFDGPFLCSFGTDQAPPEAEESLSQFPVGEIFILNTKDKSKAKQEVKHILLTRGGGVDDAVKRMLKPKLRRH